MIKSFKQFLESYPSREDIDSASKSALQSGEHHGIHVHVQIHPGARAHLRRSDMSKDDWNDHVSRTVKHVKDKPAGHYLTYSKKHDQGTVSEWMPHRKRLELITVLPKGRSNPKPGTQKHIIEKIEY